MRRSPRDRGTRPPAPPDWYKDAVIYEVHVRAFRDSGGDGIGDFRGLTEKLDYLVDLGVTALWLLPFFPSPGRDDGYDTADYTAVHPDYGTLADVRNFLAEAHRRGLRVIGEVVLNHTSDQHLWFQRARRAPPGSPWREYYVWSDTPNRYADARIIFTDTETSNWAWDPVAGAYYWHRFFSHQPDLNYENPRVRQEMLKIVDFWLDLGLDGLRLDAVPYLHEAEGTNCENLPATHDFLREVRRHMDERHADRMLLAEANQWPEDAVSYFGTGTGDECHMAFHFPLMPRIFMALRTEDRFPVIDILEQTPAIPETAQWAIFLRNHDELTLEMVTDAERDYLYRAYASDPSARINLGIRRRLAPLAGTRRRLELLYGMLLSLPGTPVLYYGDEIGMGDNYFLGDRDAVRTPMQWSPDRNAGFSEANRQRLYLPLIVDPEYHFEAVNVAAQQANPSSLLWWMKRVLGLRRRHPALARGTFEAVPTPNRHVLAYLRQYEDETILVVTNLSRYAQWCELDLVGRVGHRMIELFGGTEFPRISEAPYALSIGPHSFLWFRLEPVHEEADGPPVLASDEETLATLLDRATHRGAPLAGAFARWLGLDRGYAAQDVIGSSTRVVHVLPVDLPARDAALILVRADTRAGEGLTVPLVVELVAGPERAAAGASAGGSPAGGAASRVVARLRRRGAGDRTALLLDVSSDGEVSSGLGTLAGASPASRGDVRRSGRPARPRPWSTVGSVARGPAVRLVGRVGPPPVPEMVTAHELMAAGAPVEPVMGALEIGAAGATLSVGLVIAARDLGLPTFADEAASSLDRLLDAALAQADTPDELPFVAATVVGVHGTAPLDDVIARELAGIVETARQVGESLASIHDVLARPGGPQPLPYLSMDRRALYQVVRTLLGEVATALRSPATGSGGAASDALREEVVAARPALDTRLRTVIARQLDGLRIPRYGGPISADRVVRQDGHLVVRVPDRDYRPAEDRRRIGSPLLDVAAILVSLRGIALDPFHGSGAERRWLRPGDARRSDAWARTWWARVGAAVVEGHLAGLSRPALLPSSDDDRALLLDVLMAELSLANLLARIRVGETPDAPTLAGILDLAGPRQGRSLAAD